jgi:hypothetical protein
MKVPKKPTGRRAMPFYWWRRFRSHKCLPYKASLLSKIENGDFDFTEFYQQAKWELHWMKEEQDEFIKNYQSRDPEAYKQDNRYMDIELRYRKRYNKLIEDAMNEENDSLSKLRNELSKKFKIAKDDVWEIMSEFGGSTRDLYFHIAKVQGYNIDTLKFFK